MNKTFSLIVEPRSIGGHQTSKLRREGKIPGTIYGKGMESLSVVVDAAMFSSIFQEAGETHIVDLKVDGKTYPVLIYAVQQDAVSRGILHVEFFKVNLTEKLKTQVPVHISGESPAVKEGKGTLLTTLNEIEIEALPTNIPEAIVVDVSELTEVDMEIKVKDLKVPADVTCLADPDITVIKVGALVVEKEEPVAAAPTEGTETASTETPATEKGEEKATEE